MAIRLVDLIRMIPNETEDIVGKTKDRFNNVIREILRRETGLRMMIQSGPESPNERDTRIVKIHIVPGVPVELENTIFDDTKWLAIILAPWKQELENLKKSAKEINGGLFNALLQKQAVRERYENRRDILKNAIALVEDLLKDSLATDLLKELHAIREDVLGRYTYGTYPVNSFTNGDYDIYARIDLYWGMIGLFARDLGVTIEGLAFTVLAHELAHAYTHIGADIDGHRWKTAYFAKTDRVLKEGLAQYYALRVIERLGHQIPDARLAYERLMPKQPPEYSSHLPWLDGKLSPEEIRLALIETRRKGPGSSANFDEALQTARDRLRRSI